MLTLKLLYILPLIVYASGQTNNRGIGYYGTSNVRDQRVYPQPLYRPRPLPPIRGRAGPIYSQTPVPAPAPVAPVTSSTPAAPVVSDASLVDAPFTSPPPVTSAPIPPGPSYTPARRPLRPLPIRYNSRPLPVPQATESAPPQPVVVSEPPIVINAPQPPVVPAPQSPVVVAPQPSVTSVPEPTVESKPIVSNSYNPIYDEPFAHIAQIPIYPTTEPVAEPEPVTELEPAVNPGPILQPNPENSYDPIYDEPFAHIAQIPHYPTTEQSEPAVETEATVVAEPIAQPKPYDPLRDQPYAHIAQIPIYPTPEPVVELEPAVEPELSIKPEPTVTAESIAQPRPEISYDPMYDEPFAHIAQIPVYPTPEPEPIVKPEPVASAASPSLGSASSGALPPFLPKPIAERQPVFGRHDQSSPQTPTTTSRPPSYTIQTSTQRSRPVTEAHSVFTSTVAPQIGSLVVNFVCTKGNGFYAVDNDCDSYIKCKQDVAMKYTCPDGLHFNPGAQWNEYPCAYPSQVKCFGGSQKQNPNPTAQCPRQYGFFSMRNGDCSKFVICQEGLATVMDCPAGLAFNPATDSCDWPVNVPQCNPNAFQDFTCPAPPIDEYGLVSDIIYKYKYGQHCKLYVACHRGHPRLLSCEPGLAFDQVSQTCINNEYVTDCVIPTLY